MIELSHAWVKGDIINNRHGSRSNNVFILPSGKAY